MNPSENPYNAPKTAAVSSEGSHSQIIEQLDVAESWKRRFHLIEKAGGEKLPRMKELTTKERISIGFNIWAFLFGIIYLLIKGMWKLALTYLAASILLSFVAVALEAAGLKIGNALFIGLACGFAAITNRNYYKKMVLGRLDWF